MDWHTWIAFSGISPSAISVSQEWAETTSNAVKIFEQLVVAAQASGELDKSLDPTTVTNKLHVIINGIAALAIQERGLWPAERQKLLLRDIMRDL